VYSPHTRICVLDVQVEVGAHASVSPPSARVFRSLGEQSSAGAFLPQGLSSARFWIREMEAAERCRL